MGHSRRARVGRSAILCVVLLLAASQLAGAALIYGKAWLAPKLIARAYNRAGPGEAVDKPWPWADTRPLARLIVPELGLEQMVLDGDGGHSLAFGPGMASGIRPGDSGLVMVSGHRDTHFRFLQALQPGASVFLDYQGASYEYRVTQALIADARDGRIVEPLPEHGLLLVTCYPFDAIVAGGPLRYVLVAQQHDVRDSER